MPAEEEYLHTFHLTTLTMCNTPQVPNTPFPAAPQSQSTIVPAVKNGFSDLTKEQEGRDHPRKDVMNRCQVKALREGCHEGKGAQMGVSSREKMNTNKNLVRATTKSKSEMQTVSNGRVSRGGRDGGFKECPNIRDLVKWVG